MKSFTAIGIDALKKIFEEKQFKAMVLKKGTLEEQKVKANREVIVINNLELNLTTSKFATLNNYERVQCYQWSILHGLKKLSVWKDYAHYSGGDGDGWNQSRRIEKIRTIGDAIFKENFYSSGEKILEHISHIVLEYQMSPQNFKVFIFPLTETLIKAIKKGSINQEIEFRNDVPKKVTTL